MPLLRLLKRLQKYRVGRIRIANRTVTAAFADSFIKRLLGLMYVPRISGFECMFFDFPYSGRHEIWMRNMLFPLDIIWVNEKNKVVDYVRGVKPCREFACKIYRPKSDSRYIVEAESGFIRRFKITVGTRITRKD